MFTVYRLVSSQLCALCRQQSEAVNYFQEFRALVELFSKRRFNGSPRPKGIGLHEYCCVLNEFKDFGYVSEIFAFIALQVWNWLWVKPSLTVCTYIVAKNVCYSDIASTARSDWDKPPLLRRHYHLRMVIDSHGILAFLPVCLPHLRMVWLRVLIIKRIQESKCNNGSLVRVYSK